MKCRRIYYSEHFHFSSSGLDEQTALDIKARLTSGKNYLKTDYKLHVSRVAPCADHCSVYALSTNEPEFYGRCEHEHNISCDRCEDNKNALVDLQLSLSSTAVKYRCVIPTLIPVFAEKLVDLVDCT